MLKEARLVVAVLVLVVGPTAALSFLSARVLRGWHLIIEREFETVAESALASVETALARTLAAADADLARAVGEGLGEGGREEALLAAVTDFYGAQAWAEQVLVWDSDRGLLHPPASAAPPPAPRAPEPSSRPAERGEAFRDAERLLYEARNLDAAQRAFEAIYRRGDANALTRGLAGLRLAHCLRMAGSPERAAAVLREVASLERTMPGREGAAEGGPCPEVREPEEGFLLCFVAAQELTGAYFAMSNTAAALENEITLLTRYLWHYDAVSPLQRLAVAAHAGEWVPRLRATGGASGPGQTARLAALQAQLVELERGRAMPDVERRALAEAVRARAAGSVDAAAPVAWCDEAGGLWRLVPVGAGPAGAWAGYRLAPQAIERRIHASARETAGGKGLLIQVTGLRSEPPPFGDRAPAGKLLASRRLPAPLAFVMLTAYPADPNALLETGQVHARLYRWGLLLLAVSVVAGAGLVLREAAAEIREARTRSRFVANVSHDLRTPLASMRMLAESLHLGSVTDAAKQKQFLEVIVRECDRLTRLTERTLYFVRLGQRALAYHRAEGDVGALVEDTVRAFRAQFREEEDVRVALEVAPDLPIVRFDAGALEQVVSNLLDNAVKYSREPRHVRVRVAAADRGRAVAVAVEDRGIGIPPRERRRIFRPYYRGSGAKATGAGGTGLGLALCRHVVRAHGGRIEVESRAGEGSTFRVVLPAA